MRVSPHDSTYLPLFAQSRHSSCWLWSAEAWMLLFLVILLSALWLVGMITTTTFGGWLHIVLVVAVIFLLIRVIRGQPV